MKEKIILDLDVIKQFPDKESWDKKPIDFFSKVAQDAERRAVNLGYCVLDDANNLINAGKDIETARFPIKFCSFIKQKARKIGSFVQL